MGLRIRNIAPLGLRAMFVGIGHVLLGWKRVMLRQNRDRFITQLQSRGYNVMPVASIAQRKTCHICGFSIGAVTNEAGWNFEACSATSLAPMVCSDEFALWSAQLNRFSAPSAGNRDLQSSMRV